MGNAAAESRTRRVVSARSAGMCEARIPGVCTGQGQSMHHRKKPGRVWSPSNVIHVCGDGTRGCHGWIEHNPTDAHDRGLYLQGNEHPLFAACIISWRGIMDWFRLNDTGGLSWPGRGPQAEGPAADRIPQR